jgi:rod shape determining protein RodA
MDFSKKKSLANLDIISILIILPLIFLSYFLVLENNVLLANKQLIYFSISAILFVTILFLPIKRFIWLIPYTYWIAIILLVLVEFIGISKLGATRWIQIPFINFTIQPSEIIKPLLILMIAYQVDKNAPENKEEYNFKEFMKLSFYILLPFVIILGQPDLGTASTLLIVGFSVLFVVGVKSKIWVSLSLLFIICIPIIYNYGLHKYQKKRIDDFLHKDTVYHVKQSIIAIGSGGIFGKSKEEATQTHLKFLPIATSDFIFAYTCERFGFIGGAMIIFLYLTLSIHVLIMAFSVKSNTFSKIFSIGFSVLIFIHSALNVSMNIGLFPVVGLPLPFYSYGGSNFLTFVILLAIMQNLFAFESLFLYNLKSFLK